MDTEERDYLDEARRILAHTTAMLPERLHLEALEEAHQCEIIKIVHEIDELTKTILRRN